jgi:hypothetical protein
MKNLTSFGKKHSPSRNMRYFEIYLSDYASGKISFKEVTGYLGCCFGVVK